MKDFNKDLNKPMESKVVTLEGAASRKWGGETMVVAKKTDYDRLIKQIPLGKLVTVNTLRAVLAKEYKVDITCPLTAGIFTNIVAWASYQRDSDITPFWRVLKGNGELNEKFPGYPNLQKEYLESEGFKVIQKGKKWLVVDYQEHLFAF